MKFEWDEAKNRENVRKHGIHFDIASEVFADPLSFTIEEQDKQGEQRLVTVGQLENRTTIVVVHTRREEAGDEVIRIISARKATPRERRFYEEAE